MDNTTSQNFDFVKMTRERFNNPKGSELTTSRPSNLPFQKNFLKGYTKNYTPEQVEQFREKKEILIKSASTEVPAPFQEWNDFSFPSYISEQIQKQGFTAPTAIQSQAMPILLQGRDLIGIAQTGSGKTLAFLLPGLIHMRAQPRAQKGDGPIMLVLAPTRELAMQINQWVTSFGLHSACLYGGVEKRKQEWGLIKGVDVVIACPGRIIDFIESGKTSLDRTTFLVIDEADRMLDMGFEPQVRKIVEKTRPDRQTIFFSATWPSEVRDLAYDFCKQDAVQIQVGHAELTVNKDIKQIIYVLESDEDKMDELYNILESIDPDSKVLIFAQTKKDCEQIARNLTREGFFALSLHGDKTQQERDYVMNELRQTRTRIVVATDVAQRGLDVRDITLVINYDFPKQIEDYIHRIGRTGRAGDQGESISFIVSGQEDIGLIRALIGVLKRCQQEVPEELLTGGKQKRNKNTNNKRKTNEYKSITTNNIKPQQQQENKPQRQYQPTSNQGWNKQPQQSTNKPPPQEQSRKPEETKETPKGPVFGFFNSKKN